MAGRLTACVLLAAAIDGRAADVLVDADAVVRYVESCRKPNGAFGPHDQEYTDAAWNYPAVRTLQLLGRPIVEPESILRHGLDTPAGHVGMGHYHFFQRHALRAALRPSGDAADHGAAAPVTIRHQGFAAAYYTSPTGVAGPALFAAPSGTAARRLEAEATTFFYSNLSSLHYLLAGLQAAGRRPADPQPLVDHVRRCRAGRGFVDQRRDGAAPAPADVHLAATWHAVAALRLLGAAVDDPAAVAAFIGACRLPEGGYRYTDGPGSRNVADVYYTWAALQTLAALGIAPERAADTRAWLNSLHNADGGCGDRPGLRSRLAATHHAVEALSLLGPDARAAITAKRVPRRNEPPIAAGLRIYQALYKVPVVEPGDLDGLLDRGLNLLAIKSADWGDVAPVAAAIRARRLPMDVVLCPEAYPHRVAHLGGAMLDHVGTFALPPERTAAQQAAWTAADAAGRVPGPWLDYRERVVRPLAALGGLAYPEQDHDLEFALIGYGDDPGGAEGYNAVLVGFAWQPHDFVRVFPWRERFVDRLTPIADADAHGDLAAWTHRLDVARTLFIASGPTYRDFLSAAAAGRVVTVIARPVGVPSGATYYGPAPAVDYVRRRVDDWRWW
jgi:hypothetical protein